MEKEDVFRLLNAIPHGILLLNYEGFIIYANSSAEKYFSQKESLTQGKHLADLIPNLENDWVSQLSAEAKILKINNQDFVIFTSNYEDQSGRLYYVFVFQPLADLTPVYEELIITKQELEHIIDNSYDEIFITGGDGTALKVSAEACQRLYGVDPEELVGRSVDELESEGYFTPSVYESVIQKKSRITLMQTTRAGKKTIVTANPIFDKEGKLVRIICNTRDVTELINLKERLQETEEKMRLYYQKLIKNKQLDSGFNDIIVESPKMKKIMNQAEKVSRFDSTVLLLGESGVGKGIVARTIHRQSPRSEGPFIKINVGAIPGNLLESELFGYTGGAFTGAHKDGKKGLIEEASGGTLFMDEISEIPYYLQVKLLQVIEERTFFAVGSSTLKDVDVRIIAATNKDLKQMVINGRFREDLYYRINVISLDIPPLRERPEDIKKLCDYFVERFNTNFNMNKKISKEAMEVFLSYNWPGNVRELENCIERFLVLGEGDVLGPKHLPQEMQKVMESKINEKEYKYVYQQNEQDRSTLKVAVEEAEKQALEKALMSHGNLSDVAKSLGVSHSTVVRRLRKFNLYK